MGKDGRNENGRVLPPESVSVQLKEQTGLIVVGTFLPFCQDFCYN